MSLQVEIYPAMQAGPIHARLPRRLAHGAALRDAEYGLEATKQPHIASLPKRLSKTAAVIPGEPGGTGTMIFIHASIVACCINCCKIYGYLLSLEFATARGCQSGIGCSRSL